MRRSARRRNGLRRGAASRGSNTPSVGKRLAGDASGLESTMTVVRAIGSRLLFVRRKERDGQSIFELLGIHIGILPSRMTGGINRVEGIERHVMHLTPREQEKLLIVVAADLARRRQARGLRLNYPEAIAILSYEILEGARDGKSVAELMSFGATILTKDDVMEGVAEMVEEVQVEATFPDGTKLVTVHNPIRASGKSSGKPTGAGVE